LQPALLPTPPAVARSPAGSPLAAWVVSAGAVMGRASFRPGTSRRCSRLPAASWSSSMTPKSPPSRPLPRRGAPRLDARVCLRAPDDRHRSTTGVVPVASEEQARLARGLRYDDQRHAVLRRDHVPFEGLRGVRPALPHAVNPERTVAPRRAGLARTALDPIAREARAHRTTADHEPAAVGAAVVHRHVVEHLVVRRRA